MIKKSFLILIALFLSVNLAFAEKPLRYMPYPIVFVSGITTHSDPGTKGSPSEKWPSTWLFDELRENFSEGMLDEITNIYDTEVQTQLGEIPHLEFFFYDARQETLATNADLLQKEIEKILSAKEGGYYKPDNYTYTEPCAIPKVILVCHSYGGVIGRAMLVNHPEMQDKVAAVFFIGVPQEGSPLSVIGYFLPKEIPILKEEIGKVDKLINGSNPLAKRVYTGLKKKMESKITGNLKFMIWAENDEEGGGSLYTSTRDENDTRDLLAAITGNSKWLKLYNKLPPVKEKGTVKATLIPNELANKYSHTFKTHYYANGPYGTEKVVVERAVPSNDNEPLSYPLSEAELSTLSTDIGNDIKKHAIVGTRTEPIREGLIGKANINIGKENFNRYDYSCVRRGFWDNGDGVVNLASQKAIPGAGASSQNTHEIDAMHTSAGLPIWGPLPFLAGELDHSATPNIILQAIDDPPLIESVQFAASYASHFPYDYVIFKVKDYLLADIEITQLTEGDASSQNLNEYYDPTTATYRPYFKYGKEFLKERYHTEYQQDYEGRTWYFTFHLMPGEFVVKINRLGTSGRGNPKICLRVKNPAQKYASCAVYPLSIGSKIIRKDGSASGRSDNEPPNPSTWLEVKEKAYSNFSNANPTVYTYSSDYLGLEYPIARPGLISASSSEQQISSESGTHTQWSASEAMFYKHWVDFKLDLTDAEIAKVKSVKFTGELGKGLPSTASDFTVSVYRLSSNVWPPPLTLNDDGDQFLFDLSTAIVENGKLKKVERELDPSLYINLRGDNVWEFKSDLQEANHIPDPINGYGNYALGGYINFPALVVTFEENNP